MANIRCRGPWELRVKAHPALSATFKKHADARARVEELESQGLAPRLIPSANATWEARVRRRGYPACAKCFPTKTQAEDWARVTEGQMVEHKFVDYHEADRRTLGDIVRQFRELIPEEKRRDDPRWHRLGKMLQHPICGVQMSRLDPADFAKYRDDRLTATVPTPRGVVRPTDWRPPRIKPTTVIKELELFAHIIRHASREWRIRLAINPASANYTARPKKHDGHERDRRIDSDQGEEERLLAACACRKSPHLLDIARMCLELPLRRGEILKLTWEMVHLEDGYLALPAPINKNRKPRIVPLTEATSAILAALKQGEPSERVFAAATMNSVKSAFRRAKQEAKLANFHFHDLRHEATSRLFEQTDLRESEIGFITGHTDKRMLARYTHHRPKIFVERFKNSFKPKK